MNLPMNSLKKYTNFDSSLNQHDNVTIADSINVAVSAIVIAMGLFNLVSHKKKKQSVAPQPVAPFIRHDLNVMQKKLEQGLEKWGNINNDTDLINTFNTTMRP